MLRDIADIVIREMDNTIMPFVDDRGRPVPVLVSDMSWDDSSKKLNKRLRTNPRREPVEPEVLEALFFAKVMVVLGTSTNISYDDLDPFLEAIKPTSGVQINLSPVFG